MHALTRVTGGTGGTCRKATLGVCTGCCVKLRAVTEIRRSNAHDTFKAESVYFVRETLLLNVHGDE